MKISSLHLVYLFCISNFLSLIFASDSIEETLTSKHILSDPFLSKFVPNGPLPEHFNELKRIEMEAAASSRLKNVPVVIVPSLIGNRIEGKLSNADKNPWFCPVDSDWFLIWLDKKQFLSGVGACFMANFAIRRDPETGKYEPLRKGMRTRVPGWGGMKAADFLDNERETPVWGIITAHLRNASYVEGFNLRSAPYDWRVGPDGQKRYFEKLKLLIEETYEKNDNMKVAVASLSMGCPYFVIFCQTVSQDWKDKYIHSFTSLSGAYGGSPMAAATMTIRVTEYGLLQSAVQKLALSFGSIPFLAPAQELHGEKLLVQTNQRNYTVNDLSQLFKDAGIPDASLSAYEAMKQYQKQSLMAPGVPVNCIYGTNVRTASSFKVGSFIDPHVVTTYENGDGTCLETSLSYCTQWKQSQPIKAYPIDKMMHSDIVHTPQAIRIFLSSLGITMKDSTTQGSVTATKGSAGRLLGSASNLLLCFLVWILASL